MPNLKHLSITACKWAYFNWNELVLCPSYPRLETLTITDEHDGVGVNRSDDISLSIPILMRALHNGLLRGGKTGVESDKDVSGINGTVIVERIGRRSPLWNDRSDLGNLIRHCERSYGVTIDIRDASAMETVDMENLEPIHW